MMPPTLQGHPSNTLPVSPCCLPKTFIPVSLPKRARWSDAKLVQHRLPRQPSNWAVALGDSGSLFLNMWLSWLLLSICFKKILQGTPRHLVKRVHFWKKRQQAQNQDAPFLGPFPIYLSLPCCVWLSKLLSPSELGFFLLNKILGTTLIESLHFHASFF